ncbi:acyl-CoA dehydrogenase family protein [Sphingomonas panacis]|nr:acyl-CoA dehydrogenase family protein [Sphingomonas panacis]
MSVSDLLLEQVTRLHASDQTSRREDFDSALWTKIEELGLPLAMCPEPDGGFALRWSDLFDVITHSAACGEPTPLGETLIANALLCGGGAEPAASAVFFSAWAADVPETARLLVTRGEAPALVTFSDPAGAVAGNTPTTVSTVRYAGALLRSIQIAGALQGALDLSVRYAQERVQFGRPLAKFQAIQHMLAQLANEAVATAAAARIACAKMDAGDGDLAIAIAKLRAGRAVEKGAMLAHQIHGAIGVTMEYPLGRLTRNMWRWAEEFGDQREWAIAIGRTAVATGDAWDAVIAASDPVEVAGDE